MTGKLEAPPIQKPPIPQRQPLYWLMLFTLIALMIAMNLVTYFTRDSNPKPSYSTEEATLRTRILFESWTKNLATDDKSLEKARATLEKHRKTDELADLYYALVSYELDHKVPSDTISHLAASKDPDLRTVAAIFATKPLSAVEAQRLADSLPQDKFRYRLAGADGLERANVKGARDRVVSKAQKIALPLVAAAMVLVILLGMALLAIYVLCYLNGTVQPLGHPAGFVPPAEADQFAGKAAQMLTMFLGLQIVVGLIASTAKIPKGSGTWMNLILAGLIIVATIAMLRRGPVTLQRIGWSREKLGTHILWGLGAAVANAPIVAILAILGQAVFRGLPQAEHPIESVLTGSLDPFKIFILFVLASIQAPIFEESTFRGIIQPALDGVIQRPWVAGVISSLCFAAVHPTGIPAWPALAAIGGMSVLLTYQTRSLVPSLVMHCVHNAATLVVAITLLKS